MLPPHLSPLPSPAGASAVYKGPYQPPVLISIMPNRHCLSGGGTVSLGEGRGGGSQGWVRVGTGRSAGVLGGGLLK